MHGSLQNLSQIRQGIAMVQGQIYVENNNEIGRKWRNIWGSKIGEELAMGTTLGQNWKSNENILTNPSLISDGFWH